MVLGLLMVPGLLQGVYCVGSIPQKVMTKNGYPLFIEVHNKGSWSEENTGDNDSYFFSRGISGMSGPLMQVICVRNQEKQPV